ncbi:DNA topoisomerase III, partial [Christensenellaceae bacterium OttesenSCG-928-M15]|nr:DNA topoisomerase III [Christensenellaceae bacterium OttesenSCG-928-M15]
MYKLVIAEKPSVGQSLAAVLGASSKKDGYMEGGGYLVSWCIGHLLGLASADTYDEKYGKWCYSDLPIIPANWKHSPAKDRKKQLGVLAALMKRADVDCVINACDAGREGELIFRLVYEHCGCDKPMQRLWISSMEDSAIREGFANLRPGSDYDSLYAAALCREKADWLVGINATRLFSVHYGNTLNVGRVVSPTLAILVQREAEISTFVKEPFYTVELDTGSFTAASAKMPDKTRAENIRATCDGANAAVAAIELVDKTAAPPKLYDLTTLQREANRMWGYTAQQTLDYVQSLYDKKLATYPRTDSRFLTEDMETAIPVLVNLSALIVPGVRGK